MDLFKTLVPALLLSFSLFLSVHCEDHPLSLFGQKVKSILSKHAYEEVFATRFDSVDELIEANHRGVKVFDEIIGTPISKSLVKKFDEECVRLQHVADTSLIFHEFMNAIPKTLKEEGILNSKNLDELAHNYAARVEKSAEMLDEGKITSTFPILVYTNAHFFKSFGLKSKKFVEGYNQNLIDELKKYSGKP